MRERPQHGVLDVLAADASTGEVRCSLGYSETGKGVAAAAAHWGGWGFVSVPTAPTGGQAAMAFWTQDGNEKRVHGFQDRRLDALVGSLTNGDAAIVSAGSEARVLLKHDRDMVATLSKNRDTDKTMAVVVDGEGGIIQLLNGNSVIEIHDDKIVLQVNGGGSLVIDKAGVHIGGAHLAVNTAGGHLGQMGGAPPIVGANSIVAGPAGMSGVGSTRWTVTL